MAKLSGTWAEIADEIDAVFKKHKFSRRNFRVSKGFGGEFRLSISGLEAADSGEKISPFAVAAARYKTFCSYDWSGFKLEWLNKPFQYGGKTFILRGYDPNKPKNAMILERDGKQFNAPVEPVKFAIERSQRELA